MQASEDFVRLQATWPGAGILPEIPRLTSVPHGADDMGCALDGALVLLRSANVTAVPDAALFGVTEASDFAGLLDAVYLASATYTTLGFGDLAPVGPIRFLAGTMALTGFVLVTWSASFTYLEMSRDWSERDH